MLRSHYERTAILESVVFTGVPDTRGELAQRYPKLKNETCQDSPFFYFPFKPANRAPGQIVSQLILRPLISTFSQA